MISPYDRTPQRPMAFAPEDLWRGAGAAWCVFMAILLSAIAALTVPAGDIAVTALALGYAVVIGGLIALAAMLVFAPVAWLLGRALVRVRFRAVHILAFTTLGAGVGLTVVLLYIASGADAEAMFASGWGWAVIGASAISVVAGWSRTVHRAHRPGKPRRGRADGARDSLDADAVFEDGELG